MNGTIKSQVSLPLSVAFAVVFRGLKIRFARSLITVTGVSLGVAFLMGNLAGQLLKQGVQTEDRLRNETDRMYSFLSTELGSSQGKTIGLVLNGDPSDLETRLLIRIDREGPAEFRVFGNEAGSLPTVRQTPVARSSFEETGTNLNALLVFGSSDDSRLIPWDLISGHSPKSVVAWTAKEAPALAVDAGWIPVSLSREMRPEEIDRFEQDRRSGRTRSTWIIIISVFITVIGISNSLLMSVTERFREIGTMKCLGALSSFIRTLFLIESSLVGLLGSLVGVLGGMFFSILVYFLTYGLSLTWSSVHASALALIVSGFLSILAGVLLSIFAAIYPASIASKMIPANALRSSI